MVNEDWFPIHIRALPDEVKVLLGIEKSDLNKCSLEQKELFKLCLAEEVKRKYKAYDKELSSN